MKLTSLFFRLAFIFCLISAQAPLVQAASDVANTVHNLSQTGSFEYASNETQICIFCHTPHGGSLTGPLWNKADLDTTGFTYYSSVTASLTVNSVNALNDESMLCIACHDGTVSTYAMLNYSSIGQPQNLLNSSTNIPIGYRPNNNPVIGSNPDGSLIGGQYEDDHPISFSYDAVLSDYGAKPGLNPISGIPQEIRFFSPGNRVECSSCHDPHEADAALAPFLVMSNAGSALCLGCHDK